MHCSYCGLSIWLLRRGYIINGGKFSANSSGGWGWMGYKCTGGRFGDTCPLEDKTGRYQSGGKVGFRSLISTADVVIMLTHTYAHTLHKKDYAIWDNKRQSIFLSICLSMRGTVLRMAQPAWCRCAECFLGTRRAPSDQSITECRGLSMWCCWSRDTVYGHNLPSSFQHDTAHGNGDDSALSVHSVGLLWDVVG